MTSAPQMCCPWELVHSGSGVCTVKRMTDRVGWVSEVSDQVQVVAGEVVGQVVEGPILQEGV